MQLTKVTETAGDGLETFWAEVVDVWDYGLFGVDIGSMIIALLILGAFLILRDLFSKYVLHRLERWTTRPEVRFDHRLVEALIPPVRFLPVILGIFFAGQYLELDAEFPALFSRLMRSLIAFTIFWTLHRASEPFVYSFKRLERLLNRSMVQWIFKVLKVLIIFIGAAVILEVWGIAVGPLLAGLGLFGAAVALGAQDLFKNLIGGLTIIAEKRFHPGEHILVENVVEGTVEDIGFRSTKIRRLDKAPVHVPNAMLADTVVINFSRMTHRRIRWVIGIEYRTTVDQLKTIRDEILKYIKENDSFAQELDAPAQVRVDSFNNSSIDILVYCFTRTTVWGEWLEIKEAFAFKIKEIVEDIAHTGFAFPSQSIYVESLPEDMPEAFVPPKSKAG